MNSGVIVSINNIKDIDNISADTKYINIAIDSVDRDVIDYFLLNGKGYSYSDMVSDRNGYIYANYDVFKYSEDIINGIIDRMPLELSTIEKVRYVYIALGKILSIDINTMDDKNEVISFNSISTINNIWGAIAKHRVNDVVVSKIFMYLCYRIGVKCELVCSSIRGNIACKVYIDDGYLITDLFNDISYIQGGFCTRYFDKYNDNKNIDKKIFYIRNEYMDYYVDNVLRGFDYTREDPLGEILNATSKVIDVNNIGPCELFKIYRNIFDKYISNYDIKINNLFINNSHDKEHFILFGYNNSYYSFNYNRGCFVKVEEKVILNYMDNRIIGIYNDEELMIIKRGVVL